MAFVLECEKLLPSFVNATFILTSVFGRFLVSRNTIFLLKYTINIRAFYSALDALYMKKVMNDSGRFFSWKARRLNVNEKTKTGEILKMN